MAQHSTQPIEPDQEALEPHFLGGLRQRFKSEINRMTGGAMMGLLAGRPDADDLAFLFSYLYGWHWLRHNVEPAFIAPVLAAFGGRRAFLMRLLAESTDAGSFIRGYIDHWLRQAEDAPLQGRQLRNLLAAHDNDPQRLTRDLLTVWEGLGLFRQERKAGYADLAREERARYGGMLGEEDRQRLALVDALPDGRPTRRFAKLGVIPAMGCPQTCRHCMFIWRPLIKDYPDPAPLYELVDGLTDSVLFTGGDLTKHLDHFYRAIASMRQVTTFAILLNGDFATDSLVTDRVLQSMAKAVRKRPGGWPRARVLLQISFDEFHQEVIVDKKGRLKERIPVARIANIVEFAPRYQEIQLCLLHKQTPLNFSMDVFHKGVFARLVQELGRRDHQVQLLSSSPSPRLKRDPLDPEKRGRVMKDASFVLTRYPHRPILLTSSTIDAYGRAALLDEGEVLKDRDLLQQVLDGNAPAGEAFDTDLMFWFNGWATLFSAVHVCLGDVYREGADLILQRHAKDPLCKALHDFDLRLLGLYGEVRDDLQQRIAAATGPHQLFHSLTEDAGVRLHLTRRLIELNGQAR